ncbi:hypothetical protein FIM25_12515 [Desulfobotulus mexicanus]|uniref:Uncharacterized protein n=1 Tax=Desulfobotulus mexicanus TaxID=2586642 RepID=A0A5S5ME89_9BACT|nr:hypothetical protein FIM25_12515 [Desulfobotulus mexicanus]
MVHSAVKKIKKKLTKVQKQAQNAAKKERQKKYQWIFINGKQVRIKRPETIDGIPADEFIANNADPLWLHRNGFWELIKEEELLSDSYTPVRCVEEDEDGIPF